MRKSTALTVSIAALALSWAMAAAFPLLPSASRWSTLPPEVPFVLTPGATGEHVRSSVYYLIVLVFAGLVCAAPIEASKLIASREMKSGVTYAALATQQLLIVLDVIRSHGWDWWIFLLHLTHISRIDDKTWMEGSVTTMGPWPWPREPLIN